MPDYLPDLNDPRVRRQRYEALYSSLLLTRSSYDSKWRELADFLAPHRARFLTTDRNQGRKQHGKIIDSTGGLAVRTLASGLHAGLTSPAREWMKLTTPDQNLAKEGSVKVYLDEASRRMRAVMGTSNLYNSLPILYADMSVFGVGAMSMLEDRKDTFRCNTYAIGSYVIGLDAQKRLTTFARKYQMTVRQIVEQFCVKPYSREIDWSRASQAVKDAWGAGNYEDSVDVCWIVLPNPVQDTSRAGRRAMAWASCYFEEKAVVDGDKRFLAERGFNEMPLFAPRWEATDEDTYGSSCPGIVALGDIKGLQIMQKKKAQAVAKGVDPSLVGPSSLRQSTINLLPGGFTAEDARDGMKGLRAVHEIRTNINDLRVDAQDTRNLIERAFYVDLILMLATSDRMNGGSERPTAREVEERHDEKLLAFGPVLESTNDELLDPLVDRTFAIMERAGLLPEPPDMLKGVKLEVQYTSNLQQAQKLIGVAGQDRLMQTVLPMAEVNPAVLDKIDFNRTIDNYADMLGVDPRIVRSNKEAEALGAQRAQQQQDLAQAQQAKDLTGAAKNLGTTPMSGDTALSRLAGQAAGVA